jgi:hypothetical protein
MISRSILALKHVAALEAVLLKVRGTGLAPGRIRAEGCRHPALDRDLEREFDEIQGGRGVVIVRGMPVDAHSVEDVATMFGRSARIWVVRLPNLPAS